MRSPIVLGVDGGGTKTTALLATTDIRNNVWVVGRGVAGSSNLRSSDPHNATAEIARAVNAAIANSNMDRRGFDAVCLGLAGSGYGADCTWLVEEIRKLDISNHVVLKTDAQCLLACNESFNINEARRPAGVAVIVGTGSIVYGQTENRESRAGGWGYLIGDPASGYSMSRDILEIACNAFDGISIAPFTTEFCSEIPSELEERKRILDLLLHHLQLGTGSELVDWCYGCESPKKRIATLSPFVWSLYETSAVARRVIHSHAKRLAAAITSVVKALESRHLLDLVLGGSVVVGQPKLKRLLEQSVDAEFASIQVIEEPAMGAVKIALQHAIDSQSR